MGKVFRIPEHFGNSILNEAAVCGVQRPGAVFVMLFVREEGYDVTREDDDAEMVSCL